MTTAQLDELKRFASLLLTNEEIDELLEVPKGTVERLLASHSNDPRAAAIRAGRLLTKSELHESILTSARRHSTPAQQMAVDLLRRLDTQ